MIKHNISSSRVNSVYNIITSDSLIMRTRAALQLMLSEIRINQNSQNISRVIGTASNKVSSTVGTKVNQAADSISRIPKRFLSLLGGKNV